MFAGITSNNNNAENRKLYHDYKMRLRHDKLNDPMSKIKDKMDV